MNQTTINEIIEFAIAREEDAAAFYRELKTMSRFQENVELLAELEAMEEEHIRILRDLQAKGLKSTDFEVQKISSLSIADYLVEAPPAPDMSYQDILIVAMKKEQKAVDLYQELAEQALSEGQKKVFTRLAAEEAKHKLHFERIYDLEILKEN